MKKPRQIAAEALCKVDTQKAWSNLVLDTQLEKYPISSRDSAFAGALFYGVLERLLTLDACIGAHSKIKVEKLDPAVRCVLRMGIYQMLYMDSVPDSAAVNESVELIKRMRKAQASGFVNGVLRSFLRAEKRILIPAAPLSAALSIEYSCPAPLVELWLDSYGEEAARRVLMRSIGRPPLYVRANTCKTTARDLSEQLSRRGIACAADPDVPECLALRDVGAAQHLPEYRQGLFHVQDKSSQWCVEALAPESGMRVLDACAAPGGKSFTIAQRMRNEGEVVAADLYAKRAALVERRAAEMGLGCIRAIEADMTRPQELGDFDRVLCDVPCSGFGVIRRKPEIKYKPLREFSELPNLQYKILEISSNYCKRGGKLVYSTCTLNPAENEAIVARFLRENPRFAPASLPAPLGEGFQRTLLGEFDADGFFIAVLDAVMP